MNRPALLEELLPHYLRTTQHNCFALPAVIRFFPLFHPAAASAAMRCEQSIVLFYA